MKIDELVDQEISDMADPLRSLCREIIELRSIIEKYRIMTAGYGQMPLVETIWTEIGKNYEKYRLFAYEEPTLEQLFSAFESFVLEDSQDLGKARAALDRLWERLTNARSLTQDLPDIDQLGSVLSSLRSAFESMAQLTNQEEQERQDLQEKKMNLERLGELLGPLRKLIAPGDIRERITHLPSLVEKCGGSEDEIRAARICAVMVDEAYNILAQLEIVRDRTEAVLEIIRNSKVLSNLAEEVLLMNQLKSDFASVAGDGPVRERLERFEVLRETLRRELNAFEITPGLPPEKRHENELESVTERRRTNAGESVQRRADHRDIARASSGREDTGSMSAPRDLGRDLLQVESEVRGPGGL